MLSRKTLLYIGFAMVIYSAILFQWKIDKLEEELKEANVTIQFYEEQICKITH